MKVQGLPGQGLYGLSTLWGAGPVEWFNAALSWAVNTLGEAKLSDLAGFHDATF